MLFSSWIFVAAFLPVVWLTFRFLQRRRMGEAALLWLIAASLFFYGWFKPVYVFILLVSIGFNFTLGTQLARQHLKKSKRKTYLVFGIAANLAALGYYKYAGLFFETLNAMGVEHGVPQILLPLAISFFTFQQIAYLVDAYRGETKEFNFRHYALFVTFFPQLIAGPIVHHKEMIPQFIEKLGKLTSRRMLAMGLTVFVIGLFKKLAIADYMGDIADPVFAAAALRQSLTVFEAWVGMVAYTLQIYFDFSGYSDMAVGLGALFGIRLPLNFFSPYKSGNIIEFWRRWHITLSRFLRDYLYIPLGGNRKGGARRYANLMVTMLLGGLWHGAGWTFMAWGGLHGFYLIVNHAWRKFSAIRLPHILAVALTFLSVALAWVFFRADSFATAGHILNCATGKYGIALLHTDNWMTAVLETLGFEVKQSATRLLRLNEKWYIFWLALLAVFFAPSTHELMRKNIALDITKVAEALKQPRFVWRASPSWAVVIGLMAAIAALLLMRVNAFIYFQF
ncbi:MAG: MBOAT family protein [Pseudomonadota bacterium]|nr:MBOAT family protein [Pseudomonadota bacterium]QKK06148.1 MAG: MBOAT family protein [Pseudomonadota bacterium]